MGSSDQSLGTSGVLFPALTLAFIRVIDKIIETTLYVDIC